MASDGDADDSRRINEELRAYTSVEINRLVQEHMRQHQQQPAALKDVEREFCVLQSRWAAVKGSNTFVV